MLVVYMSLVVADRLLYVTGGVWRYEYSKCVIILAQIILVYEVISIITDLKLILIITPSSLHHTGTNVILSTKYCST